MFGVVSEILHVAVDFVSEGFSSKLNLISLNSFDTVVRFEVQKFPIFCVSVFAHISTIKPAIKKPSPRGQVA